MKGIFSLSTALLAATAAATPTVIPRSDGDISARASSKYVTYTGDGSNKAHWPATKYWATWDSLWSINSELMKKSCGWAGYKKENTPTEIAAIKTAIIKISGETGVDQRFILSVIMNESGGCVRVKPTENGVNNPGLMQSHNGTGTCENVYPCPASSIYRMIKDGTNGTGYGDGLKQCLSKVISYLGPKTDSQATYAAARMYNSGSVNYTDLGDGLGSTNCYSTNIANIIVGRVLSGGDCKL